MNTSVFWRRRRDSNSRTDFGGYTISSRAPSTRLGDFSISSRLPQCGHFVRRLTYDTTDIRKNQVLFEKKYDLN